MSNIGTAITTSQQIPNYGYTIFISIGIVLFLIIAIAFIAYLFCYRSTASTVPHPRRSLDNTALNALPMLTYIEAKRRNSRAVVADCCSICLVDYEEEDDVLLRLLPACGHIFHVTCVDPWVRQQQTCPTCRSPVMNGTMPDPSPVVVIEQA